MHIVTRVIAVFLAAAVLAGCAANRTNRASTVSSEKSRIADARATMTVEQVNELVGGKTSLSYTYTFGHGTQIEYLSDEGTAHLWYPGNTRIVKGYWKAQRDNRGKTKICFSYPGNTYNPETGHRGGGWECTNMANYLIFELDRQPGDVFGLEPRADVPHILDRHAAKPYAPRELPVKMPYVVDGKTVIQHLQEDWRM